MGGCGGVGKEIRKANQKRHTAMFEKRPAEHVSLCLLTPTAQPHIRTHVRANPVCVCCETCKCAATPTRRYYN
eukprot:3592569-Pyramimonas_sp.AAC.1